MISYEIYKILHLAGIALILLGLGTVLGGYAISKNVPGKLRLTGFLTHGLGMVLALTGGFGMAARLGMASGFPQWIYAKIAIWFLLGVGISLAKRKASWALSLILFYTFLVAAAAGLALFKPGA